MAAFSLAQLYRFIGTGNFDIDELVRGAEFENQLRPHLTKTEPDPEAEPSMAKIHELANTEIDGETMSAAQINAIKAARIVQWTFNDVHGLPQPDATRSGWSYQRLKTEGSAERPKTIRAKPAPGAEAPASKKGKVVVPGTEMDLKLVRETDRIARSVPGVPDAKGRTYTVTEIMAARQLAAQNYVPTADLQRRSAEAAAAAKKREIEQGIEEFVAERTGPYRNDPAGIMEAMDYLTGQREEGNIASDAWRAVKAAGRGIDAFGGGTVDAVGAAMDWQAKKVNEALVPESLWPNDDRVRPVPRTRYQAGTQNQPRNAPPLLGHNRWGESYLQWLQRGMRERNASPPAPGPAKRARGVAPGAVAKEEAKKKKKKSTLAFWKYKTRG